MSRQSITYMSHMSKLVNYPKRPLTMGQIAKISNRHHYGRVSIASRQPSWRMNHDSDYPSTVWCEHVNPKAGGSLNKGPRKSLPLSRTIA